MENIFQSTAATAYRSFYLHHISNMIMVYRYLIKFYLYLNHTASCGLTAKKPDWHYKKSCLKLSGVS